jgi:hypothetical protein
VYTSGAGVIGFKGDLSVTFITTLNTLVSSDGPDPLDRVTLADAVLPIVRPAQSDFACTVNVSAVVELARPAWVPKLANAVPPERPVKVTAVVSVVKVVPPFPEAARDVTATVCGTPASLLPAPSFEQLMLTGDGVTVRGDAVTTVVPNILTATVTVVGPVVAKVIVPVPAVTPAQPLAAVT